MSKLPDNDYVVGCNPLQDIHNGSVTVASYKTGVMAVYSCDEGFGLVGQSTRLCMNNSTWCGVAPVCRCELISYILAGMSHFPSALQLSALPHHQYQVWIQNILQYFLCLTLGTK